MWMIRTSAVKLTVAVLATGALTVAGAGVVSAATGTGTTAPGSHVHHAAQFSCADARGVLAKLTRSERRIAAGLPKLTATATACDADR